MVIGSGPIIIGQACEFDYSGTQACRVLTAEGIRVVLVNSNPATIMTDPEFADATYVEPITPEFVEKVIAKERPDALLADPGRPDRAQHRDRAGRGRRAREVRRRADRRLHRGDRPRREPRVFKKIVEDLGGEVARSAICHSMDDCLAGGRGARLPGRRAPVVHDGRHRLRHGATTRTTCAGSPVPASPASPTTEVLLEESILGWKEYELEVMRDTKPTTS